jgi:uncharacterized protein
MLQKFPQILQSLSLLYLEIDKEATRLSQIHASRLCCRPGCAECCMDGISVNEVEAENIRRFFPRLLKDELPHSEGACAFLDEKNKCRIYAARPYVCRTQGLPLHWVENQEGQNRAFRDICPQNDQGALLEELSENQCWKIGWVEEALAKLQHAFNKGSMTRINLRDLFRGR